MKLETITLPVIWHSVGPNQAIANDLMVTLPCASQVIGLMLLPPHRFFYLTLDISGVYVGL